MHEPNNSSENNSTRHFFLSIPCDECAQPNTVAISQNPKDQFCAFCSATMNNLQQFQSSGFVYFLSNLMMPGLLKIGQTERAVEERVNELSKPTSVPSPFEIEFYYPSDNPKHKEAKIHEALRDYRIENKEFFRITPDEAILITADIFKHSPVLYKPSLTIQKNIDGLSVIHVTMSGKLSINKSLMAIALNVAGAILKD